ncbi:glycosyltransferase [Verticiella sediminum]|uniref:Glycosyltransferase n=1 Tax=Verticiella sediminum TaxID=1247510 RepID=A0A556AXX6_9BURK|nr:glycosyltransferase [Verticiella sediminum]TSH97295.1 glycosyltransferase [Verticiella sediminum]
MLQLVTPPAAGYAGAITGLYEDVLQGWAWHSGQPDVRVTVEVYIDGGFAALARADQMQTEYEHGDGFHGFAVQLKRRWLEDAGHIAVRIANQGPWLDGALTLPESKPPVHPPVGHSQVWYPGGLKVTGWVWDPDAPDRTVEVIAYENGKPVARAQAGNPHPALVYQPDANHGYSLDLPWSMADGEVHLVELRDDRDRPLVGSPITVCTLPEGMEALLRRHWPGKADDPELALLLRLAQDQDRRAPRTIGFEHYHEWFQVYQRPTALPDDNLQPALKAGILLFGEGSHEDETRTRASLAAQRWPAQAIERAEPGRLLQAVHALLVQNVDAIVPLHLGDHLAPHGLDTLLRALAGDQALNDTLGVRTQPTRGAAPDGWLPAHGATQAPAWAYADNDCDGPDGRRTAPWLKPAWDIDLYLGVDLVTPGAIWSADIVRAAFALPAHPPGGDIDDLAAAIALATVDRKAFVAHVPRVLYHKRADAPRSPADAPANPNRDAAMQWLAERLALGALVTRNGLYPALLQTKWPLPPDDQLPRVSLIVPTRDHYELLHACVEGLLTGTDYPYLEIIVIDNESTCPRTLAYMDELRERGVVVMPYSYPFNYSAMNNLAVEIASGEIIGLINNDIEVIEPAWLKAMVAQLLQPGVGIVGAKLLWPNEMVQHAGVVLGVNGQAAHAGNHWRSDDSGYLGANQCPRRQDAVTAACLILRKADYARAGRLDAKKFAVAFNDVDLCLRIGKRQAVLWTTAGKLRHRESASRGKDISSMKHARSTREQMHFMSHHHHVFKKMTAYHPLLNRDWANGPYAGLVSAVAHNSKFCQ